MKISAHEVMEGHWYPRSGYLWAPRPYNPKLPLIFEVDWQVDTPRDLLSSSGAYATLKGEIDLGKGPIGCMGDLRLDYFGKHRIAYDIFWRGGVSNQDLSYQLHCEKTNLKPWNLHRTHTNATGNIRERSAGWCCRGVPDPDGVIGDVEVHFPMRTALQFLSSIRLQRG